MKTHNLKTVNPYFEEVFSGRKTFEMRKNDRDFQPGDLVILMEYDAWNNSFSGRVIAFKIGYVLYAYSGLQVDFVVFSLLKL